MLPEAYPHTEAPQKTLQALIKVPKPKKKRRKIVESPKSGSEDSFEPDFN